MTKQQPTHCNTRQKEISHKHGNNARVKSTAHTGAFSRRERERAREQERESAREKESE
jgi:hypothetical protein